MVGKTSAKQPVLKPRFRVVCGKNIAFGPGKAELLGWLLETESLSEAARRMDMSYMRAWTLVKTINACFRHPAVVAQRGGKSGGGMKVTETGRLALRLYEEMESSALESSAAPWRRFQKLLRV